MLVLFRKRWHHQQIGPRPKLLSNSSILAILFFANTDGSYSLNVSQCAFETLFSQKVYEEEYCKLCYSIFVQNYETYLKPILGEYHQECHSMAIIQVINLILELVRNIYPV